MIANPEFIVAHGGVAVITAIVLEEIGTPVSDGTVVQFFTNLGRIEEQVKTKGGIARANLVSDSRSGDASVSVISGGVFAEASVAIGSALPANVILVADPPSLRPGQTSYLTVNVFDENGNPVANVPVVLSVESPGRDTLASGGRQLFTDSNGQVFDQLHAGSGGGARTATVTATTASGEYKKLDVSISSS